MELADMVVAELWSGEFHQQSNTSLVFVRCFNTRNEGILPRFHNDLKRSGFLFVIEFTVPCLLQCRQRNR